MFNEKLISLLEFWNWNFRMWKRKFYSRNNKILISCFSIAAPFWNLIMSIVFFKSLKKGISVIPLIVTYRLAEM